jgi:hypothetical protein
MNEAQLIKTIKVLIAKGDHAKEKSEQFYIAAGQHLKTLKAERKGNTAEWEALLKEKCGIGKSRAYELMKIADGRTTVEEVRAEKAESMRKVRAVIPPRGGKTEELAALAPSDHLQRVWDAATPEIKQEFIETNGTELKELLVQQRKRLTNAVVERAIERVAEPPAEIAPPPVDLEIPTFLRRVQ